MRLTFTIVYQNITSATLYEIFYMKAVLAAYSDAIGEINFYCLEVFLSRVMRCQDRDPVPGLGKRTGSTLQQ